MNIDPTFVVFAVLIIAFVIVIPITFNIRKSKKNQGGNTLSGSNSNQTSGEGNSITNIGSININGQKSGLDSSDFSTDISIDEIKARIKILFVDDKDDFSIINMLKKNGYKVDYLPDVEDLDSSLVKYADIIFLDINGVGVAMKFKNQGMGLCGALRDHYKDSKRLILYSGETEGNIFDNDAKKADATLPKDSDLYQFTSYITQYGKELLQKAH